ncbi:hypothetical protein [Epilithonimonas xixisoli]|uniref:Uncharacterized protein n=1 Tax=Epilithonimonas xixisoli TaxID=1476462 RepID=A0A4R8IF05_9FLAO|nr:hypothetical protein [Epilithonimonas xixisoli]TDX83994.1 hypothetical protein B0I22_1582 [Epilithonimonas xixisoli]
MAEVIYSLNGKYFKDYDIFISSSDGLFDGLKPKKQNTYDWAEYSGTASDITQKKRFEPRKFTLVGFVKGSDWKKMMDNFWTVFGDLNKPGRQRLLIKPFDVETLVYDVTNEETIDVKKTFKNGECYAIFTVKLVEQKPIKKILYIDKANLQLSFNTPKWVEVNIDGNIGIYKNSVVINQNIPNRILSPYDNGGRNLAKNSKDLLDQNSYWVRDFDLSENLVVGKEYTVTVNTNTVSQNPNAYFEIGDSSGRITYLNKISSTRFEITFTAPRSTNKIILFREPNDNSFYQFLSLKIEKGNKSTGWTPAPEDQHFIVIAGEIDEITNLTTNAEVLWEKL